jgi:hypothetical protein
VSWYEYQESKRVSQLDVPFYGLIMAAMRQADSHNVELLKVAFPSVWTELWERYNAAGGYLNGETHGP